MMCQYMERFNKIAVERELSAGAILLWQQLYCMMERKNSFADVKICTAVLLGLLNLTRNGFQKARKALIDAGVLEIRQEGSETFYTLELVKFPSDCIVAKSSCSRTDNFDIAGQVATHAFLCENNPPLAQSANMESVSAPHYPSGDIIHNSRFEQPMQEFTDVYHNNPELDYVLRQWVQMRKDNGWELSLWGLQELLKKLAILAAGDIKAMIATVRQSIARRWKGFHPLRKESKPSGEKLRQEERQQELLDKQQNRTGRVTHKFRNEGRDLEYLVQ